MNKALLILSLLLQLQAFTASVFTSDSSLPRINGIPLTPADFSRLPSGTLAAGSLIPVRIDGVTKQVTFATLAAAIGGGGTGTVTDRYVPFNNAGTWNTSVFYIPVVADDPDNLYKVKNGSGVFQRQTTDGTFVVSIPDETAYFTIWPTHTYGGGRITTHDSTFGDGYTQFGGITGISWAYPSADVSPAQGWGLMSWNSAGARLRVDRSTPVGSTSSYQYTNDAGITVATSVQATSSRKDNRSPNVSWVGYGWNSSVSPPVGGYEMRVESFLALQDLNDLTRSRWTLGVLSNGVAANWLTLMQVDLTGNLYLSNKVVFGPGETNVLYRNGTSLVYTNGQTGSGPIFKVVDGLGNVAQFAIKSGVAVVEGPSTVDLNAGVVSTLRWDGASWSSAGADNSKDLGATSTRWRDVHVGRRIVWNAANTVWDLAGTGNPEGSVSASPGSLYRNTTGGSGVTIYYKATGTGNTGWEALSTGVGGSGGPNGFIQGVGGTADSGNSYTVEAFNDYVGANSPFEAVVTVKDDANDGSPALNPTGYWIGKVYGWVGNNGSGFASPVSQTTSTISSMVVGTFGTVPTPASITCSGVSGSQGYLKITVIGPSGKTCTVKIDVHGRM